MIIQKYHLNAGDTRNLSVALELDGQPLTQDEDWTFIATCKEHETDSDAAAKWQKTSAAGIAISGTHALLNLVRLDTIQSGGKNLYFDVHGTHTPTNTSKTVAKCRLAVSRVQTLDPTPSIPIYTTEPPAGPYADRDYPLIPIGGVVGFDIAPYTVNGIVLPGYPDNENITQMFASAGCTLFSLDSINLSSTSYLYLERLPLLERVTLYINSGDGIINLNGLTHLTHLDIVDDSGDGAQILTTGLVNLNSLYRYTAGGDRISIAGMRLLVSADISMPNAEFGYPLGLSAGSHPLLQFLAVEINDDTNSNEVEFGDAFLNTFATATNAHNGVLTGMNNSLTRPVACTFPGSGGQMFHCAGYPLYHRHVVFSTTGTLPEPLIAGHTYLVTDAVSGGHYSVDDLTSDDLTTAGSGVHTCTPVGNSGAAQADLISRGWTIA